MIDTSERTTTTRLRAKIREKCILLGLRPAPRAASFSEENEHLSEAAKRARQELQGFAHQRRVQSHH